MNYSKTFAHAYETAATEILDNGEIFAPRGSETKEIRNYTYTITDPYSNLYDNSVRSIPKKYLATELIWYLAGSNNVKFISQRASLWNKIKNPDGKTVNSAYGYLLFNDPNKYGITEWEWAKTSLADDIHTRQAVIRFNKPEHSWFGNRDFVCTLNGIFMVRDNMLHLTINQRSCDIMTGLSFDVPFFTLLMQLMIKELEWEHNIKLEMGTFTHVINSLHVYEKDYNRLTDMVKAGFEPDKLPEIQPEAREKLENIISDPGNINSLIYNERSQSIEYDDLLYWCFTNINHI